MFQSAVLCRLHTAGYTIACAVAFITQERAAPDGPLLCEGLVGVVAFSGAFWVFCSFRHLFIVIVIVIVRTPFPYIPCHIVQAVAIGEEGAYRRRVIELIIFRILVREMAVPEIAFVFSFIYTFISPRVDVVLQSTPCRIFPFRLRREAFARPFAVGRGVFPGNLNYGKVLFSFQVAARAVGVFPAGALFPGPPLAVVVQWYRVGRGSKYE